MKQRNGFIMLFVLGALISALVVPNMAYGAAAAKPKAAAPAAAAPTAATPAPAAAPAAAPGPATPAGQYKIGVCNRKEVFDKYTKQIEGRKQLEADKTAMEDQLDKLRKPIQDMEKDLRDRGATMPPAELEKVKQKHDSDLRGYEFKMKDLQSQLDVKSDTFMKKMKADIDETVGKIGKDQSYHLILEGDPKMGGPLGNPVLYFMTNIEITSQVITMLNSAK